MEIPQVQPESKERVSTPTRDKIFVLMMVLVVLLLMVVILSYISLGTTFGLLEPKYSQEQFENKLSPDTSLVNEQQLVASSSSSKFISYKIVSKDQQLFENSPDGEKRVVVPSTQKAIPELSSDRGLRILEPSPVSGFVFFADYKPETDSGTGGFYSFDADTGQFSTISELNKHNAGWGDIFISPDGLAAVSAIDEEGEGKNLYLIDLTRNTSTVIKTLGENETFIDGKPSFGDGINTNIYWVDNTNISYSVYSSATETNRKLLRNDTLVVLRTPATIENKDTYELEEIPKEEQYQKLVAFENNGSATTLVDGVNNTLPELGKYGYLSQLSIAKEEGKLFTVGHICDGICPEVPTKLYSFDLATGKFSSLPIASRHWSSKVRVWAKTSPSQGSVSEDGLRFISIYDDKNPDDRSTLYLINLKDDTVKVLNKLPFDTQSRVHESFVRSNDIAEIEWLDAERFSITVFKQTVADGYYRQPNKNNLTYFSTYEELRKETFSISP